MHGEEAQRFRRALAAIFFVYLAWGLLYVWRTSFVSDGTRVFLLWDDAMISMRYARNLFEGAGPVWNAGEEPVQGYTNLGLMLVMAASHAFSLAVEKAALPIQLIGMAVAGVAVVATGVWVRTAALGADLPAADRLGVAAALGCAALGPLGVWAGQGGEGAWVAAWLAVLLCGVAQSGPGETWPRWSYAWLVVGPILRPDAGLLAVAAALPTAIAVKGAVRWRHLGAVGAWLTAVVAGLFGFGWAVYGDPLPNTFHLKATGMERFEVLAHAWKYVAPALPHLVVPGGLAVFALRRHGSVVVMAAAAACVAAGFVWEVWIGGDWLLHYHRFSTPVLPVLVALAVLGASPWLAQRHGGASAFALPGCALLLGVTTAEWPPTVEWWNPRAPTLLQRESKDLYEIGQYVRDHTAPSTRIAVHWAGIPPYVSGRPALDVLGKSDRRIARTQAKLMVPGHSKWDWDYVLRERKPDLFLSISRWVQEHPLFWEDYYSAVRNSDRRLLFVRKDALAKLHDLDVTILEMPERREVPHLPPSHWRD